MKPLHLLVCCSLWCALFSPAGAQPAAISPQVLDQLAGPLAFSPDGHKLVSYRDAQVKFWSRDGRHLLKQLQLDAPVTDVRFTPDGRFFAVGTQFGQFTLWRSSDFVRLAEIRDPGNWQSFALSPDGVYLSICKLEPGARGLRFFLHGWDLRSRRVIQRLHVMDLPDLLPGHPPRVSVAFHPLGGYLSAGVEYWPEDPARFVMVRDLLRGKWLYRMSGYLPVEYSLDGQYFGFTSLVDKQEVLKLWHLPSNSLRVLGPYPGNGTESLETAVLSRHGRYFARIGAEEMDHLEIQVIETATQKIVLSVRQPDAVNILAFSPDERFLLISASSSLDFKPLLYRLP